jgi:DNA-binding response OmpR family regulator
VGRTPRIERVAVLDDDVQFIRLIERALQAEQIEVQPVTTLDLDEAVRVVAETGCQTALVDVYMYNDIAGFRLIEKLRAHAPTSAIGIIVTSGAHREVGRHVPFLVEHRCGVLLKPFGIDELIAKLRAGAVEAAGEGRAHIARAVFGAVPRLSA